MNGVLQTTVLEPVPDKECSWMPEEAPVETALALDGAAGCIADARARTAEFLARARSDHALPVSARALELAQLVVSELVTNALKYAPGPVMLELRAAGDWLEITVWDTEPVLPTARRADAGRVGQHGLEIVMAVADGFEAHREPVGKRITARLTLLDPPVPNLGG
ncbi:anti-sigma regulatory factor (Ser/Thr protein kinase) [Streptomyces sp. TLI_55]|uniref:ATP-binding protein n=1 Tax=Streptomyces sp. TLI_55 TaxID=1938861 RepID=UPI000BC92D44|nr:ATP-binding protein [Streptomyces sp. TLI_55]SNX66256.1 anti-sigma regulatory factor (Ser/Thr protein kinase) [Streptomyces sp. TLI_55]